MSRLKDRVALVTGGASGIGLATARRFLDEGASVVIVDRDEEQLRRVVAELGNGALSAISADLSLEDEHDRCVAQVESGFGRLDIAVFNAGIEGLNTALEDYPVAVFDEVLAVNLRATWLGLRSVVPLMKRGKRGSIILNSSVQGLSALGGTTAYTTSKHALVGMMKGASLELAPFNIRVNTVHPGYVATPMMQRIHESAIPDDPGRLEAILNEGVPMGRYAGADEIAALMAFLASDDASYSTGSCFVADGGLLARLP